MSFDSQFFTSVWHEIFSWYASTYIDVFYNKLLTQQNVSYILYWIVVVLLIAFVLNFIFQNNK